MRTKLESYIYEVLHPILNLVANKTAFSAQNLRYVLARFWKKVNMKLSFLAYCR